MARSTRTILSGALVLAMVVGIGGCATSRTGSLDTATAGVDETRSQLNAGVAQVDAVMAALDDLTKAGGDGLGKAFDRYRGEVKKLEDAAEKVRARRVAMQTRVEDHIRRWEQEIQQISGEQARTISAERKDKLAAALQELGRAMDALKEAYEPFVSNLHDIELVLANDLSVGGMAVANPLISEAIAQAEAVKSAAIRADKELADAIAEFKR